MKLEDMKRPSKKSNKTVPINIKITPAVSKWLKAGGYSPTLIFDRAIRDLQEIENVEKRNKASS